MIDPVDAPIPFSRVPKPIVGLQLSKGTTIPESFTGKPLDVLEISPGSRSSIIAQILPPPQISPVKISGEYFKYTNNSNIQISKSFSNEWLIFSLTSNIFTNISNYSIHMTDTPDWFLPTITNIVNSRVDVPKHLSLQFSLSTAAAIHNMQILQSHGNSLQDYISSSPGTFISPGSEFRPVDILEPLFLHHHNWPKIKCILLQGSNWPLRPLSNADRIAKNQEFIIRGNHKSALQYESEFLKTIESEIKQGWMIPLPLHYINKLQHGELAPIGIDDKVWAELPDGSRKTKFRLTHDQSFEALIGSSVNKRTDRDRLHPLFYGGCLSRLIHYI